MRLFRPSACPCPGYFVLALPMLTVVLCLLPGAPGCPRLVASDGGSGSGVARAEAALSPNVDGVAGESHAAAPLLPAGGREDVERINPLFGDPRPRNLQPDRSGVFADPVLLDSPRGMGAALGSSISMEAPEWNPRSSLLPDEMDLLDFLRPDLWSLDTVDAQPVEAASGEAEAEPDVMSPLVQLAMKVAPAVVTLRAWSAFGEELAGASGFFISPDGAILTDMEIVHPEICESIDYITATTGDGRSYEVTGVWGSDVVSGLTLLRSTAAEVPFLVMDPNVSFETEQAVTILAVHHTRGLIMAEAGIVADDSAAGEGWLNVRGKDSAGAVGSPVLNGRGDVIAMISMRLPMENWINYAVPIGRAVDEWKERPREPLAFAEMKRQRSELDPKRSRAFSFAYQALYEGRYQTAAKSLLKITRQYPRSAESWALLGLAAARLGAWEEALEAQRKAVALDPTLDESWYQLAMADLKNSKENYDARSYREALEKTVLIRPGDRLAWMLLGQAYLEEEDFLNADLAFTQVIKLENDFAQAHFLLGFVRAKMQDYGAAEAAVKRCLELDNNHARAWYYLGLLQSRQGRHEEARIAFETVTRLEPEHPTAWLNLAKACLATNLRTEAREAWKRHERILNSGGRGNAQETVSLIE